jgi:hypothetical protein
MPVAQVTIHALDTLTEIPDLLPKLSLLFAPHPPFVFDEDNAIQPTYAFGFNDADQIRSVTVSIGRPTHS